MLVVAMISRWLSGSTSAVRSALANRDLRRIELAWAAATSGEFVAFVAIGLFAYQAGGATAVGTVAVIQMVPAMVVAPLAGLLGDRFRRELVTMLSDLVRSSAMGFAGRAGARSVVLRRAAPGDGAPPVLHAGMPRRRRPGFRR